MYPITLIDNSDEDFQAKIPQHLSCWFCPWLWDPKKMEENRRAFGQEGFLSIHYWRDHAMNRPPICVRCPDGSMWLVDQVSSNGTGWVVTGEAPFITCSPSIVVTNYHGWLRDGVFTPDLEHRTYPVKSAQ